MKFPNVIGAVAAAALSCMAGGSGYAFDQAKYPDWAGQWLGKAGEIHFDQSKPRLAQHPPLTPEYQASMTPTSRTRSEAARASIRPTRAYRQACRGS